MQHSDRYETVWIEHEVSWLVNNAIGHSQVKFQMDQRLIQSERELLIKMKHINFQKNLISIDNYFAD